VDYLDWLNPGLSMALLSFLIGITAGYCMGECGESKATG
jgi:hypothetical protein